MDNDFKEEVEKAIDEEGLNIKDDSVEKENELKQDDNNLNTEDNKEPQKKKNNKKGLIILIVVLIVIIIGLVCYLILNKPTETEDVKQDENQQSETKNNESNIDEEKKIVEPTNLDNIIVEKPSGKYKITLYKNSDGYLNKDKNEYYNEVAFEIPTTTKNAKFISYIKDKTGTYVLYKDDSIKTYDVNKKMSTTYKLIDSNYDIYDFVSKDMGNPNNDIKLGIKYANRLKKDDEYELTNVKDCKFYDFTSNTNKFDGYCVSIDGHSDDYIVAYNSINEDKNTQKLYILDRNTGNVVFTKGDANYPCGGLEINQELFTYFEGCIGDSSYSYYTKSGKEIISNSSGSNISTKDGNIYYVSGSQFKKFDSNGKEIESKKYNEYNFVGVYKSIGVSIKNYELKAIDFDNDKRIDIARVYDDYVFHNMISGYYSNNELSNENEKEAGIYLIVGHSEVEGYDNGPGVEYYINPNTYEIKKYELEYIGGYAKPMLYLYPKKKTKVEVSFEHNDYLTTTYPKFNESWNVTAYPNGDLYDKDNKYYYGLYWEENLNHKVDFKEGFYVDKDNAINFLEEKLSYIGLNDRERNEFITYWLPILEKNGKSLVYFELTEERDSYNKINISPKPDSMLRMAIHIKKINNYTPIKEQKLTKFKRKGFSVVEWGGVNY